MHSPFLTLFSIIAMSACSALPPTGEVGQPATATEVSAASEPDAGLSRALSAESEANPMGDGRAVVEAIAVRPSSRQKKPRNDGLSIWSSADFQRRFAESYLAESDIEPLVTEAERELLLEVRDALAEGDIPGAKQRILEHLNPAASATLDFTLANLHFQDDELEAAARHYASASDKYPKFRRAWKNQGLVGVRLGDYRMAAKAFSRVIELGGGDALTWGLLGFAHVNQENFLPAESAYRMAILLDSETTDWKMGLARSLFKQARYPEAVSLLGAMIDEEPGRVDLWVLQANAFLGKGEVMSAAENFEFVQRLGEASVENLAMLGDIYINEELYDMAMESYLGALALAPDVFRFRALGAAKNLAARGAFAETGQLLDAIESASSDGLKLEEQTSVLRLRARLAVAHGDGEGQVEILKSIVAMDPLDGSALLLLGQHADREGDHETAIFYYERAADLEGFEADANVRHAQLLVGRSKYIEALALLRRAQALRPRDNIQAYLEQVERVAANH